MAEKTYTATVAGDGTAVVTIQPTTGRGWRVQQVSNELASAPAGSTCTLRRNGYFVTALIPTGDAAVEPPPLRLLIGDVATVEWAGCTPGTVGKVLVIFEVLP